MGASTSTTRYSYQPLKPRELRLLSLVRDTGEGGLCDTYKLNHVEFEDSLKFIALSYVWGNQEFDCTLVIRDDTTKTGYGTLPVTRNVKTILRYLDQHYNGCSIWIDAICIDQTNIVEKNYVVPRMGIIYYGATKGVVWLGESDIRLQAAINGIPQILEGVERLDLRSQPDYKEPDTLRRAQLPPRDSLVWLGIGDLFTNPWWKRTWTFQEAVNPEVVEVMCGHNIIPWATIDSVVGAVQKGCLEPLIRGSDKPIVRWEHTPIMNASWLMQYVKLRQQPPPRNFPFLPLLMMGAYILATNPADKIYGNLGLATHELAAKIKVDYRLPVSQIYLDFAKLWLSVDPHPILLHMASSKVFLDGLPSWCPNFNFPTLLVMFADVAIGAGYRSGLRESTANEFFHTLIPNTDHIRCRGFNVDRVDSIVKAPWVWIYDKNSGSLKDAAAITLRWEGECLALSKAVDKDKRMLNEETVPSAHYQSLIANSLKGFKPTMQEALEGYQLLMRFLRHTVLHGEGIPFHVNTDEYGKLNGYTDSLGVACQDRRFFSTRDGRIGLGPKGTMPGDTISVFFNGATPFILRAKDSLSHTYELVGESYVNGLMYGEVFDIFDSQDETDFILE